MSYPQPALVSTQTFETRLPSRVITDPKETAQLTEEYKRGRLGPNTQIVYVDKERSQIAPSPQIVYVEKPLAQPIVQSRPVITRPELRRSPPPPRRPVLVEPEPYYEPKEYYNDRDLTPQYLEPVRSPSLRDSSHHRPSYARPSYNQPRVRFRESLGSFYPPEDDDYYDDTDDYYYGDRGY